MVEGLEARPEASSKPDEKKSDGAGEEKPKGRFRAGKRPRCRFCQDNVSRVDYKDVNNLQNLVSPQGKIVSRRRSGNCARHQRMVQKAIKQARYIGLLSYTEGQAKGGRLPGRSW